MFSFSFLQGNLLSFVPMENSMLVLPEKKSIKRKSRTGWISHFHTFLIQPMKHVNIIQKKNLRNTRFHLHFLIYFVFFIVVTIIHCWFFCYHIDDISNEIGPKMIFAFIGVWMDFVRDACSLFRIYATFDLINYMLTESQPLLSSTGRFCKIFYQAKKKDISEY